MADSVTAVYDFVKPEVGGSDDTWGTKLNADIDKIETLFASVFADGTPTFAGTLKSAALPESFTAPVTFGNIVTLEAPEARLRFVENDQTAPAGCYQMTSSANTFRFQKATGPAENPFSAVQDIFVHNGVNNIFTIAAALAALSVGTELRAESDIAIRSTASNYGRFTNDTPPAGFSDDVVIYRPANNSGGFMISNPDASEWLAYFPNSNTFRTSTRFNFEGTIRASRIDIANSGNRTLYFGTVSDADASGYVSGQPTGNLVIHSGNPTPSGFILSGNTIETIGATFEHTGQFILNSGVGEKSRWYTDANGTLLRGTDDSNNVVGYIRFDNDGTLFFSGQTLIEADTDIELHANIYARSLPQPGNSTQQVNERNRIAGHNARMAVGTSGTHMLAQFTGVGAVGFGDTVAGNLLRPANTYNGGLGAARPSAETWSCLGFLDSSTDPLKRTTMWQRVS